ncbi:MAG: LacI family DNA-binding transcriptional regulator [Verrucomicrobia bacterium]|nr:LacI family DNA-binding transcriptional regulator [Verrucomicrobiota bacterium]
MKTRSGCNIHDVAKKARVSVATVSRVLNNNSIPTAATRERVLQTVQKLNYRPHPAFRRSNGANRLARSDTRTLGYFTVHEYLEKARRDDGYYSRVLTGIQQAAQQHSYHVMIESTASQSLHLGRMVSDERVDGLLVEGTFPEVLRKLLIQRLPIVFINRYYPELPASSVMPNISSGVFELLEYLWSLGHRNIATFQPIDTKIHHRLYLNAFKDFFLQKNTLITHPRLSELRSIDPGTHQQVLLDYAQEALSAQPRPTAIVTWNVYASTLITTLQERGIRVPQDISLIGMDDTVDAGLTMPPLTSYHFPVDEIGFSAAELLIRKLQNPDRPPHHITVNGQLIRRASCEALPKSGPERPGN